MDEDIQNVVILAGGKGTRMREHTEYIPKPMVEIGGIPILIHIINYFDYFSKFNYFICTGYKGDIIIDFIQDNNMENVKSHTNRTGDKYRWKNIANKRSL